MKKSIVAILVFAILAFSGCAQRDAAEDISPSASPVTESRTGGDAADSDVDGDAQSGAESPDASADSLSEEESMEDTLQTEKLIIPEGFTLAKIAMRLEEMGVCTAEEFINESQNGDYSGFSLIAAQEQNPNRCFRLEGYLFPDTYEIYTTDSPKAIIDRMLTNMENKITPQIREQIANSGYTIDEILAMASIIQKEGFGAEPMPTISSVLHNRLNEPMPLQCDVTIAYVEGAIKPFIDGDINRYNSYYNTFKCAALPAGAICNPGMDAIEAALNPADTDYFFFVTDSDKNYHFSEKWEEHSSMVDYLEQQKSESSAETDE